MSATVTAVVPAINRATGSTSFLMVEGDGFTVESDNASATCTTNGITYNWSGGVAWTNSRATFALLELTMDSATPATDDVVRLFTVTVDDSKLEDAKVDLYEDTTN